MKKIGYINFIDSKSITGAVKNLVIDANKELPGDLCELISKARKTETSKLGLSILNDLLENIDVAKELSVPICQDTGMAVFFVELGQSTVIIGDLLEDAINEGVRQGYAEGFLRCSVVKDPLERVNTNDNTPAIIHTKIVKGSEIKITAAPKGFGSENMSGIKMLTPAATREDIIESVADIVKKAGSNPCPPMVIGVGIGGDFEYCALLSKKALCRPVSEKNKNPYYAGLEQDILNKINTLGIGVQGFGGKTTALSVNIEEYPTHIAGLPLAVNIGCHVTRHKTAIIK